MSLKIPVFINEVNNLSDARYCAGMGVEMVGFSLDESHPRFIEVSKVRDISLWLSGVKTVGAFQGNNLADIQYLAEQIPLHLVQLNHLPSLSEIKIIKVPVILKLHFDPSEVDKLKETLTLYKDSCAFFLLKNEQITDLSTITLILKELCASYPVIIGLGLNENNISALIEEVKPAGISLKGGDEIKPGLKSFEELSSILELLEND